MTFTKLDSGITDSTIWRASDTTRIVWITMLAMADQNGYVGASVPGLADRARVPLEACLSALEAFKAPDPWSRTTDHEGRRIADADGGWMLLNHAKYRAARDPDVRREQNRSAQERWRNKQNKQRKPESAQAEAEAEAEKEITQLPLGSAVNGHHKPIPDCPHQQVIALWADVLPAMPQPVKWTDTRAEHLRARWREAAAEHHWQGQDEGLAYFRKLFVWVSRSKFLTGKAKSSGDRTPFVVELAWLVKPENFAKVIEGRYHQEEP